MAKIVEAVRPNTASRIAAEQRAIDGVVQEIEGLRAAQTEALLADDPSEADKLADKIAAAERRLGVRRDRVKPLQGQDRREKVDRRQQQKDAALIAFEKKFSDRAMAATRVGAAIAELGAALKAYRAAARAPFEPWPEVFPDLRLFQDSAYSNLDSRIGGALHMRSPGDAHALLINLPIRLGDLAEADISLGASLVESIKSAPVPPQHNTENEDEAA